MVKMDIDGARKIDIYGGRGAAPVGGASIKLGLTPSFFNSIIKVFTQRVVQNE